MQNSKIEKIAVFDPSYGTEAPGCLRRGQHQSTSAATNIQEFFSPFFDGGVHCNCVGLCGCAAGAADRYVSY